MKWFLHTFTRLCELQRICYGAQLGVRQTKQLEWSLESSNQPDHRLLGLTIGPADLAGMEYGTQFRHSGEDIIGANFLYTTDESFLIDLAENNITRKLYALKHITCQLSSAVEYCIQLIREFDEAVEYCSEDELKSLILRAVNVVQRVIHRDASCLPSIVTNFNSIP
uniref:Uncharacterized protein n=1 Tax=Glossina austeni TaxID=7395 RepID=A0A1A9VT47_GLOAU